MDYAYLGKLVEYERGVKNISCKELTKGVCSEATLRRLEYGIQIPSFFVLERLLERLGKSVNKIEFLYNETDYEIYYLREGIENTIEEERMEDAQKAVDYYLDMIKELRADRSQYCLHIQYIYKIRAIISMYKREYEGAKSLLLEAITITIPDFKEYISTNEESDVIFFYDFLRENIVGEEEFILLLLWMQATSLAKGGYSFTDQGKYILKYIEKTCDDEEVKANVYSKGAWIFSEMALRDHRLKEAYQYALEGEKVLSENGLLLYLPQFLDRILQLSYVISKEEYEGWRLQRDSLKQLYEEFKKPWAKEDICVWRSYRQKELYLLSELLVNERKLLQKSQEEMAEATQVDLKTINRLEKGRFRPKSGTFKKLKDYMMFHRDICSTRIVADDFSLLEMERKIAKLNNQRKEEEAERLYEKLKISLSESWEENRQYMAYMEMLFNHQLGRIDTKKALEECRKAFFITGKQKPWEGMEGMVPGRMESFILTYMARCYYSMSLGNEAISLLEGLVGCYEKSRVNPKYHHASLSLLYEHLAIYCEEMGRLEEAIDWCNKAISFDLYCNRGGNLGFILEQRVYTEDRIERKDRKRNYLQAYYLLKLMKQRKRMEDLQNNYYKFYGMDLEG